MEFIDGFGLAIEDCSPMTPVEEIDKFFDRPAPGGIRKRSALGVHAAKVCMNCIQRSSSVRTSVIRFPSEGNFIVVNDGTS